MIVEVVGPTLTAQITTTDPPPLMLTLPNYGMLGCVLPSEPYARYELRVGPDRVRRYYWRAP